MPDLLRAMIAMLGTIRFANGSGGDVLEATPVEPSDLSGVPDGRILGVIPVDAKVRLEASIPLPEFVIGQAIPVFVFPLDGQSYWFESCLSRMSNGQLILYVPPERLIRGVRKAALFLARNISHRTPEFDLMIDALASAANSNIRRTTLVLADCVEEQDVPTAAVIADAIRELCG